MKFEDRENWRTMELSVTHIRAGAE